MGRQPHHQVCFVRSLFPGDLNLHEPTQYIANYFFLYNNYFTTTLPHFTPVWGCYFFPPPSPLHPPAPVRPRPLALRLRSRPGGSAGLRGAAAPGRAHGGGGPAAAEVGRTPTDDDGRGERFSLKERGVSQARGPKHEH